MHNYLMFKQLASPSFTIRTTGLVILDGVPWLADTPGAMEADPAAGEGIVEVKCPFTCRDKSLRDAVANPSFCLSVIGEGLSLKTSHTYYYQVQQQMHVTNCEWADFVVWTLKEMFAQRIARDRSFSQNILPKLQDFYFEHLLPALFSEHL